MCYLLLAAARDDAQAGEDGLSSSLHSLGHQLPHVDPGVALLFPSVEASRCQIRIGLRCT